jgi:hypothetical protein
MTETVASRRGSSIVMMPIRLPRPSSSIGWPRHTSLGREDFSSVYKFLKPSSDDAPYSPHAGMNNRRRWGIAAADGAT